MKFLRRLLVFSLSLFSSLIISYWQLPAQSQSLPDIPFNQSDWDWYDCDSNSENPDDNQNPGGDSDLAFGLPLALKLKFPFDLVYPVNPQDLAVDDECLETSLWGIERQLCAPMVIAKTAKNVFLLKVTLQFLFSL